MRAVRRARDSRLCKTGRQVRAKKRYELPPLGRTAGVDGGCHQHVRPLPSGRLRLPCGGCRARRAGAAARRAPECRAARAPGEPALGLG
jgi:hypothetical protein